MMDIHAVRPSLLTTAPGGSCSIVVSCNVMNCVVAMGSRMAFGCIGLDGWIEADKGKNSAETPE